MSRILTLFPTLVRPGVLLLSCLLLVAGCQYLPGGRSAPAQPGPAPERVQPDAPLDEAGQLRQQAETLEQQQQYLAALDAWLAQTPLLMADEDLRANSRHVWRVLSQMRHEEFAQLLRREQGQLLSGWVSLAYIQRFGANDLEQQASQLQDWQRQWPMHPANRYLPEDMKLLKRLKEDQPRHIALLLPLSGKQGPAGRAVRDGFLAAYYRALAQGGVAVRIDLLDTESSPDLLSLYGEAVSRGARMVIGPLEREQVQVLANEPALAVPVLALNETVDAQTPSTLYQFSLSPEEEARQTAITASAAGLRHALVISSQQDRGERLAQRFISQWQAMGGRVVAQARYSPDRHDYTAVVGEALNTPDRNEIDMVFLAGKAHEAVQVLPALAYHNASTWPVYGLSQLYQPHSTLRGNDLDGVRICLSPWQLGQGSVTAAFQQPTAPDPGLVPLYAMGADAQHLYLRLALMEANPNLTLDGHTGYLRMNQQRHIERGLAWVMLQSGRPVPMPDMLP